MFLHYPLDPRADIPAALSFAENYVSSLPARPKKIILVSGIPESAGLYEETRARLSRLNTTLEFVRPGTRTAPAVTPQVVTPPVVTPQVVTPPVVTPPVQAQPAEPTAPAATPTAEDFMQETEPFYYEPLPDATLYLSDPEQEWDFAETVPSEQELPEPEPAIIPTTAPAPEPKPIQKPAKPAVPALSLKEIFTAKATILTLSGIFWLLALIIPVLFLAAALRKIKKPRQAATGKAGLLIMNLYVEDQSTYIGRRNIHALKPGYSYTVGGKDSDFLIFVVNVPPHIAKIRNDGNGVTFTPLSPRHFPDLGSKELKDCVGKTIRIISDNNYQLRIRFDVLGTKPLKI
jgi:hypothetical protein